MHSQKARDKTDVLIEILIYSFFVIGPWVLGSTVTWAIWIENIIAYVIGLVWLMQIAFNRTMGLKAVRWSQDVERNCVRWVSRWLAVVTVLILVYCLVSALNARATWRPDILGFEYYEKFVKWLPHSYDHASTWFLFWQYLGLALVFWSTRDWLLGKTRRERIKAAKIEDQDSGTEIGPVLPDRLRRLLWVLSINGAVLGLEGILQRFSGTNKLLWVALPPIIQDPGSQFGPYAYRSNAAQYLNMIWPICLGFWWVLHKRFHRRSFSSRRVGSGAQVVLLPCVIILVAAPIITTSRGGALVAVAGLLVATIILSLAEWRGVWWHKMRFIFLGVMALGFGAWLGWKDLAPRLDRIFSDKLSGRGEIWEIAHKMTKDYPWFGIGPGTFASVSQLYRTNLGQIWSTEVHDDWLETRATFGWVGYILILSALAAAIGRPFFGGEIKVPWVMCAMVWLAMGGCLIHALGDFPFQVHSTLSLFVILACVAHCITFRGGSGERGGGEDRGQRAEV